MANVQPIPIQSSPGIKRDGTTFEGQNYTDGQWCRFQRGKPRKILGYRNATPTLPERVYGMLVATANGQQYAAMGSQSKLTQVVLNSSGVFASQNNRTPAGLVNSADNLWQFDVMYDSTSGKRTLVGHAGENLSHIDSTIESNIFIGDITATGVLTASLMDPVSGGVVALGPYLVAYGNDGRVDVSALNDPGAITAGSAFIAGSKIVKGMRLRGNGAGPSGLFWTLTSLERATFTTSATAVPFAFDTLSDEISILSSQSVIEYDGIFYWVDTGRFMRFNGVVQEIPNDMNLNFFFDNVNTAARQSMFSFKVPRFGEIWWCFPMGTSTVPNWAIIFNVREGTWYDTPLPGSGRSAGYFAQVYAKPFMVDLTETGTGFSLWQHETGVNSVNGSTVDPIESFFVTSEFSLANTSPPDLHAMRVSRAEPDFVQTGDMTIQVRTRANARAALQEGEMFTFPDTAANAAEQTVPLKQDGRLMSFKFSSNTPGGNYQMGKTLGHIERGDGRVTQ